MAFKSEIHVAELASIRTGHAEGDIYYILDNGMLGDLPCKPGAFVKWHNDTWQIQPDEHYALASAVNGEITQALDNLLDNGQASETIVVAVPSSQSSNYTVGNYYEVQGKVARLRVKTDGDNVTQLTFDTTSGLLDAMNDIVEDITSIGSPLQWKGPATVAQLNWGITGIQPGWTYTLTNAGTLTDDSIAVEAGDEVAWTGTAWFKLGPENNIKIFQVNYSASGYVWPSYQALSNCINEGKLPILKQVAVGTNNLTYYKLSEFNKPSYGDSIVFTSQYRQLRITVLSINSHDVVTSNTYYYLNGDTLASGYSSSSTYSKGDYCIYNGNLYRCSSDISTAESWTPSHWTKTNVTDLIGSANIPTIDRFLPPMPRDQSAVMSTTNYAIDVPIDSTLSMGWLLTGLRAPSSGIVKAGDRFELRFNASPYLPDSFDIYFGLAELTGIDNSTYKQSFDVISQKIAPRKLTGVTNSLVGASGEAPLIFTFSKDVSFEPDEYIYLMMGVKRTDLTVSPTTLITCPCVAQSDYNNPIQRVCMAHNCLQRDVNSTFADSTGILATTFEVGYGNPEDNFMARGGWNNKFGYPSISINSIAWDVSTNGTPALAELYLMKV